jgi:hypothetical protein
MGLETDPDSRNLFLFSTQERLSQEWHAPAGAFVPQTAHDDLARIDELWNESTEGFVARNETTLNRLKDAGTPEQRRFIERYLDPTKQS